MTRSAPNVPWETPAETHFDCKTIMIPELPWKLKAQGNRWSGSHKLTVAFRLGLNRTSDLFSLQ